jgi:hypothetical protein
MKVNGLHHVVTAITADIGVNADDHRDAAYRLTATSGAARAAS